MFKFVKIFFVVLLYWYVVRYQKSYPADFVFYLASILFFLSIIFSLFYKNKHRVNIFLISALSSLSMIFALYAHFLIGILTFFTFSLILFFYCYVFISFKIDQ
ncbi:hypothetical protein UP17_08645 [Peribacillus simplex]|nr:hypothetical protein UP17_08645 [Peribacillus simplex]SNT57784.1 hypothetical protein SAMN05444672_16311 [Bacillus sp. OK838]